MRKIPIALAILFASVFIISAAPAFLRAQEPAPAEEEPTAAEQEIEELKKIIADRNSELEEIEKEIASYQKQIEETGKESDSLKKTLKRLEAARGKLLAEIKATENKITVATANIKNLDVGIAGKNESLNKSLDTLGAIIRNVDLLESKSIVEMVLAVDKISDVWENVDTLSRVGGALQVHIEEVRKIKQNLEEDKKKKEDERKRLLGLKTTLADQKKIVEYNQSDKNKLLKETSNKESEYRKLLAERLAQKNQLEKEIYEFESKLQIAVDPTSIPKPARGVLKPPLDALTVTQYFGNTSFASKNPQVYNGMGHNGVDFRASVGTPVKSSEAGKVIGTGDTDKSCYGVSYGKWVLIEHYNGLTTLYAHLSLIKVAENEPISPGQVIGYSGNTGYSTGPHLHFAVFVSSAVHVSGPTEYKSRVCKTYLKLPVSPPAGYLNPIPYL